MRNKFKQSLINWFASLSAVAYGWIITSFLSHYLRTDLINNFVGFGLIFAGLVFLITMTVYE